MQLPISQTDDDYKILLCTIGTEEINKLNYEEYETNARKSITYLNRLGLLDDIRHDTLDITKIHSFHRIRRNIENDNLRKIRLNSNKNKENKLIVINNKMSYERQSPTNY